MAEQKILTNDDERVAFAAQLGWDVHAVPGDDVDERAKEHFQLDALRDAGHGDALGGVDQELLDEVRAAALRRQRQSAPQPGT